MEDDAKILSAEDAVPAGRQFASLREVADYAVRILAMPWFRLKWPHLKVVILYGDEGGAASNPAEGGVAWMRLSEGCRHEKAFLHELSHILSDEPQEHGPIFQKTLVRLVEKTMGETTARALAAGYERA